MWKFDPSSIVIGDCLIKNINVDWIRQRPNWWNSNRPLNLLQDVPANLIIEGTDNIMTDIKQPGVLHLPDSGMYILRINIFCPLPQSSSRLGGNGGEIVVRHGNYEIKREPLMGPVTIFNCIVRNRTQGAGLKFELDFENSNMNEKNFIPSQIEVSITLGKNQYFFEKTRIGPEPVIANSTHPVDPFNIQHGESSFSTQSQTGSLVFDEDDTFSF